VIPLTPAGIARLTGAGRDPVVVAALGNLLAPGDVVLVKASRAAGLERMTLARTAEAAQ
jgi:UDP-N-acetylmuramyl pentapeptide synthase